MSIWMLGVIALGLLITTYQVTGCDVKPLIGCYTENNYRYQGHSIFSEWPKHRLAASWQECKEQCDDQGTKCKYWSYRATDSHCWLKTKDALSGKKYIKGETFISGNANCPGEGECYTEKNYGYQGYTIFSNGPRHRLAVTWQQCKKLCEDFETKCRYWSYRAKDKHCWLKTKDALSGKRYIKGFISGNANYCGAKLTDEGDKLDAMKAAYKSLDVLDCMYLKTVRNYLPKLMAANKMEDGDVGIDDGTTHKFEWSKTLSLLEGDDVITKRTNNKIITINGTVSGNIGKRWYGSKKNRPTGLYAGPGDIVTLTIPQRLVGKIKAFIGHNEYSLTFPLNKRINQIASPWGGHIIIFLENTTATKGEFQITIGNALRAPSFVYGQDTNEDWNNEIKKFSPKWASLRIPGQLDVYIQILKIKDITDMEGTLAKWKNTMDLLEELIGLPPNSQPGAEVLNFKPGIGGGYHVGVCKTGTAFVGDNLYTEEKNMDSDYYDDFIYGTGTNPLILHEFGHGFCYRDLPDMGAQWTAETVRSYIEFKKGVNHAEPLDMDFYLLSRMVGFALYSNGKSCGTTFKKIPIIEQSDYDRCERWLNYIPIKEFGWDTLKQVFSLDTVSTVKYTSEWDRMVDLYCKATKHNLIPLFKFYNIKVSEEIAESCKKQPDPVVITKLLQIANCVKESMESNGKKDMKDCAELPLFPEHKGICVLSGVCHKHWSSGKKMEMTNQFDLMGSRYANTANNKENCLGRPKQIFKNCKNNWNQKKHIITATFYANESGQDASSTYP